jgi:lipopolysaccharide/colanic/teichoic acid biosynthesis glycosyltransferase
MKLEQPQALMLVQPMAERLTSVRLNPKRWRRLRFYAGALALDCLVVVGAFGAANLLRYKDLLQPDWLFVSMALLPIYLLFGLHQRSYSADVLMNWRLSAVRTVGSLGTAAAGIAFIAFFLHASADVSRELVAWGFGLSLSLLVASRYAMRRYAVRLFGDNPLSELLLCDGVVTQPLPGMTMVDARAIGLEPDINDPHMLDRLGRLLLHVDRVVVSCTRERRVAWGIALKGANIHGEVLTPEMDELGPLGLGRFGSQTATIVSVGPLSTSNRALKRGLDLMLAVAVLFVVAPLMALVALAIKLDSHGPIFFVQNRLGRANRLFAIYKFRSMKTDLCDVEGRQSTTRIDTRVTRIGRFIRATSIDELPQVLNVLKGDMSFVGPRPHALGSVVDDKLFWEVDERYWHRHTAKPGITGLAQIRGYRGTTYLREDLVNRLQADLDYLNGWTIWRDVAILIATVRVLIHKNAY